MKKGDYVIRLKGTGLFFSSGSYHKPDFDSFLVASPFSSVPSAAEAALFMQVAWAVDKVLQVLRVPELPDVFAVEGGIASRLANAIEDLTGLDCALCDLDHQDFKSVQQAVLDARHAITKQFVVAGISLGGEDVVQEIGPADVAALKSSR